MQYHDIYDFDDTLNEFSTGFRRFMFEDVVKKPVVDFDHSKDYVLMHGFEETGLTCIEALKLFEASGRMNELIKPSERFLSIYDRSYSWNGDKRTVLTARGWMDHPAAAVHEWFETYNISQPDVVKVVGLDESKADYIASIQGEVHVFYEDNPHHLYEAYMRRPKNIKVCAADRVWNRHIACDMRVY